MKIRSVIIDHEPGVMSMLKNCLQSTFPDISVEGEACNYTDGAQLIRMLKPQLVFSEVDTFSKFRSEHTLSFPDFVFLSHHSEDAITAIRQDACGFMLKPLDANDVAVSIGSVIRKLMHRDQLAVLPHNNLIGIPTIEGIEFLNAGEIIRCEGLQKCTRVVSVRKNSLVSAYNIGEFRKLLDKHGFFACHKSHLINLMHVTRYSREGLLYMTDNVPVPLARRKRIEFLHLLKHL